MKTAEKPAEDSALEWSSFEISRWSTCTLPKRRWNSLSGRAESADPTEGVDDRGRWNWENTQFVQHRKALFKAGQSSNWRHLNSLVIWTAYGQSDLLVKFRFPSKAKHLECFRFTANLSQLKNLFGSRCVVLRITVLIVEHNHLLYGRYEKFFFYSRLILKSYNFLPLHHLVMRMAVSSSVRRTLGARFVYALERWKQSDVLVTSLITKQKRQTWIIMSRSLREFDLSCSRLIYTFFKRCSMMACN